MKAKVTEDGRFIQLYEFTELEIAQINQSLNKRIANWRFHPLVVKKIWNGYISFINKSNLIPIGLWDKLKNICDRFDLELEFDGLSYIKNEDFKEAEFREWLWDFLKDSKYGKGANNEIREYQIKACVDTITYYKSRSELATSAGKTLIMFIIYSYLYQMGLAKKQLIIVPNSALVIQSSEDFLEYAENTPIEKHIKIQMIGGGRSKIKEESNLIIGTFQTLRNLDKEFFDGVECVCVDEAHHTNAKSIKDIILKVYDSKYRYGLSGTLVDDDTAESFTLDAYLGPTVNKVSAKFLIDNNYATPIFIKSIILNYMPIEGKEKLYNLRQKRGVELTGSQLLDLERNLVMENKARFDFITDTIAKTTKNTLVLFQDIKNSYGKNIYHRLREITKGKVIYYVDGDISSDLRDEYKSALENGNNKILIASFGTFSTGISIKNIHHIFFTESYKSERIIRQSIGRGMRLHDNKEKTYIWDFVDDYRYGTDNRFKNNYLFRHGQERIKIYKREGFPYKIYKINF